jgi:hypothetical protein
LFSLPFLLFFSTRKSLRVQRLRAAYGELALLPFCKGLCSGIRKAFTLSTYTYSRTVRLCNIESIEVGSESDGTQQPGAALSEVTVILRQGTRTALVVRLLTSLTTKAVR